MFVVSRFQSRCFQYLRSTHYAVDDMDPQTTAMRRTTHCRSKLFVAIVVLMKEAERDLRKLPYCETSTNAESFLTNTYCALNAPVVSIQFRVLSLMMAITTRGGATVTVRIGAHNQIDAAVWSSGGDAFDYLNHQISSA